MSCFRALIPGPQQVQCAAPLEAFEGHLVEGLLQRHCVLRLDELQQRMVRLQLAAEDLLLAPGVQHSILLAR